MAEYVSMGGLSLPHLIVVGLIVLVLFGRGRISEMMGDFGKGIKSFKQGMADETDRPVVAPPPRIEHQPPQAAAAPAPATRAAAPMDYDPVSAPPTTDPNPPHPVPHSAATPAPSAPLPFDPVTAPATADDPDKRG
jgi:sec-independent protein translocase protein TatA